MISDQMVRLITREVRQAIGIERTPSDVRAWLMSNVPKVNDTMLRKLLDDRDALLRTADRMRIKFVDDAPPSSEWE